MKEQQEMSFSEIVEILQKFQDTTPIDLTINNKTKTIKIEYIK
jgi:hypothetical protein